MRLSLNCILLFALLSIHTVFSQDEPPKINSEIKSVKVFTSGAQVTRTAQIHLIAGKNAVVLTGLSPQIKENSVQVTTPDFASVTSVKVQLDVLSSKKVRDEVKALEDRLERLRKQRNDQQDLLKVYKNEESILLKNQAVAGENAGLKMLDLKAVVDYQKAQYTENLRNQSLTNAAIKSSDSLYSLVNQQLNEVRGSANKQIGELLVSIQSDRGGKAQITFTYFVDDAGWAPVYDLKVTDISAPVDLATKAEVYQNTNEDWKNVQLSLSSGNPTENAIAPTLRPWYVAKVRETITLRGSASMRKTFTDSSDTNLITSLQGQVAGLEISSAAPGAAKNMRRKVSLAELTSQTTTVTFDVKEPFTVLADGNMYTANLSQQEIPASYRYFSVPKLDKAAYLNAEIRDWQNYNLLPGAVNLYFEGTYLGQSFLNVEQASDTLSVSLGRDKAIVIDRVKRQDFTKKQF
ncbi:DUF4139 domain-containing protein, partial [Flavobacterium sp.]|uniref:DUF4139 domain-containing protein n=1 Tax=Flavobacterium sp. TaxID=239 RepID=UPI003B993CDB